MTTPSHEAIAQRAREIWQSYGSPEGRDTEIWLEAERQLAGTPEPAGMSASSRLEEDQTTSESKGASGLAGREQSDSPVPTQTLADPVAEEKPVKSLPPKKPARSAKATAKPGGKVKPA